MPRNTSNTRTSSQSTFGQIHPESNQYIDAFANWQGQVDPTIAHRAAASRNRLNASFMNPAGGYQTAQMMDARRNAANRSIDEQVGMETRAGQYDLNNQRLGQLSSLASLMSPRIVEQSRSGEQNTSAGQNLFGNLLNVGLGAANVAMM